MEVGGIQWSILREGGGVVEHTYTVALAGNPNVGKSTVFNRLTGLRQHTGNWPGKTVERAEGYFSQAGQRFRLVDLPGTYSLAADSLSLDSLGLTPADSLDSLARDTIYRLVKGFRNVRIYRSDFQSVCDSLVAVSRDSTIHLYIDPVLWNQNSQITSDVMDIFTANSQIVRAEFVGRPLMVSELDTMHYNQVAGKTMTALFRNNQIYRNDVKGNAQTIYFMQEDDSPDIIGLLVLESGDLTFFIEEKQVVKITYRNNPVYTIYPMDKIPPDVDLFLKDFKWEAKRRPAQRDVFDRTIRPSIRAAKSSQSRPQFPIAARIDAFKRRLIESRRWSDRNDVVQPDVIEWMYSLGWRPPEQEEESLPVVPLAGNAKETSP